VCGKGFRSTKYFPDDIETIQRMDEETYRSAGGAAGWAITGGVLTGGLGLLAGAAIGGRRRQNATYLIRLRDVKHVVVNGRAKLDQRAAQNVATLGL
jgi:hypothetical protein